MSRGTAEYIAYKAHVDCLGRKPTKADLQLRADEIIAGGDRGPVVVYATLFESDEGKNLLARQQRAMRVLLAIGDERGIE